MDLGYLRSKFIQFLRIFSDYPIIEIHVCRPPFGTIVVNKLEQSDIVKVLNGKTYFTVTELNNLKQSNPSMYQSLCQLAQAVKVYVVNEKTPFVLAGTLGELWTVSLNTLAKKYVSLKSGSPTAINPSDPDINSGVFDWIRVRTIPDNSSAFACFVPNTVTGQVATSWGTVLNINAVGVNHGKGDFVIASNVGNSPNLNDIYVINGNIFAKTYNNQGWTDYLDSRVLNSKSITVDKLPRLTNVVLN